MACEKITYKAFHLALYSFPSTFLVDTMVDIDSFVQSSMRIFNVSRKPDMQEYRVMAQITGLGIIIIGVVGFLVKLLMEGLIKL